MFNKTVIYSALVALLVSVGVIASFLYFSDSGKIVRIEHVSSSPVTSVTHAGKSASQAPVDFTATAEKVVNAVVHIKSTQSRVQEDQYQYRQLPDPFRDFFGDRFLQPWGDQKQMQPQPRVGTGSGVIINDEGYIVTNNHVIADADDIEVTLHDNRTYKATVIGTDPSTDIALVQIREEDLPSLAFVNSDDVKVGEWVLAVGNPFSLNSTVTAGIISAKGRNININRSRFAVESFIQTDAAINPGNSGGALVNLNGDLIGINTAIASPTGAYSGYGFAVPSNIVQKVIEDLINYGVVQRGVLGVMIRSVDGNLANEKDLALSQGVYVDSLLQNSAAGEAGVEVGDVITAVDDIEVKTSPELQEIIAQRRPGDEVALSVNRQGRNKQIKVVLSSPEGRQTVAVKEHKEVLNLLGADLQTIDKALAEKLELDGGVKVVTLYPGRLRRNTQMREGFIITHVDGRKVKDLDDFANALKEKTGGVLLEGVYEDIPGKHYYAFGIDRNSM